MQSEATEIGKGTSIRTFPNLYNLGQGLFGRRPEAVLQEAESHFRGYKSQDWIDRNVAQAKSQLEEETSEPKARGLSRMVRAVLTGSFEVGSEMADILGKTFFKDFFAGMVSVGLGAYAVVFCLQIANSGNVSKEQTVPSPSSASGEITIPQVQEVVTIQPSLEPQLPPAVPTEVLTNTTFYQIQSGDTLSAIARRFGVTLDSLAAANGIVDVNLIVAGEMLAIPSVVPQGVETGPTYYSVRAGDNLWSIALAFGVTVDDLVRRNGIVNPNLIQPGDVLEISG